MKTVKYFIFVFSLALICISAKAQFGYKENYKTTEGIHINYKWTHSKFLNKQSPLQLRLKIKNTNDYDVDMSFQVAYLIRHIVQFTSPEIEICIPAGRARTGKWHGLYFQAEEVSNDTIRSDVFDWELLELEISKTDACD